MRAQTYLVRRDATYYFRCRIPNDLKCFYGDKNELKVSLRTTDRFEAAQLAREKATRLSDEFDAKRRSLVLGNAPLRRVIHVDKTWADRFCNRALRAMLETDDDQRRTGLSSEEFSERAREVDKLVTIMREAQARGDIANIKQALEPALLFFGYELDCDRDGYLLLAHTYLAMATRYVSVLQRRYAGDVVETDDVAPEAEALVLHPTRKDSDTVDSLFQDWKNAVENRPSKTVSSYTIVVNRFTKFIKDAPPSQLKRGDFLRYRDYLLNECKCAVRTVEKHLGLLCSIFQIAVDNERLPLNPALRLKVPRGKVVAKTRVPYTIADLEQIVSSPLYRSATRPRGGGGEAAVWLPLLGMYTGARLEELGQLTVGDIHEAPGLGWYMEITDSAEHQHVKTNSSRRRVPLHQSLIDAGFLRYRDQLVAMELTRLFPLLTPDRHGTLTASWSKWWGRYARKDIGITDKRKVFHSFRHLFKMMCRDAGIIEEVHDALTGHGADSVGRSYGGEHYPLKPLFEAMAKYQLAGLVVPVVAGELDSAKMARELRVARSTTKLKARSSRRAPGGATRSG